MNNIRSIITELNIARSNDCSPEKSEEIKGIIQELLPLAKMEEESGVDFWLLDKICSNGVYCFQESIREFKSKRYGKVSHIENSDIHIQFFGPYKQKRTGVSIMGYIDSKNSYYTLPIKDYGKTWALTKEELE